MPTGGTMISLPRGEVGLGFGEDLAPRLPLLHGLLLAIGGRGGCGIRSRGRRVLHHFIAGRGVGGHDALAGVHGGGHGSDSGEEGRIQFAGGGQEGLGG